MITTKNFLFRTTIVCAAIALLAVGALGQSGRGLVRGAEAVARLQGRLDALGARYGRSGAELRRMLLDDQTLWVDGDDALFFVDEAATDSGAKDPMEAVSVAPYPLDQTFLLNSRPGASRTIYLDFDGHMTTGTGWNQSYTSGAAINSVAFSLDADTANFSDAEREMIQWVWQRVAEDYAPFDVNVTTQFVSEDVITRSSSSDAVYGTRVVFSPTNFTGSSIGGIAYVGVYNNVGTFYQPAFVMTSGLNSSDTFQRAKFFAEAASHEVGHNVGLRHDGKLNADGTTTSYYSGHGSWAPIMGVGYNRPISQWSKGEYPGANNTEDDLAIIPTYGMPFVGDDHSNSTSGATVMSGNALSAAGVISTRTDVDYFQFSAGTGNAVINVTLAPHEPNLDVIARILDAQGNEVAASNPAGLTASFNLSLAGGTYYLTIDGTGAGDLTTGYSDYGSLGQYFVSGNVVPANGQAPVASANASATSGSVPLTVNFSSSGSSDADGSIVSYNWDFGDGSSSALPNPSHTYVATGTYNAVLTVVDNSGLADTASVTIVVSPPVNQLPVAVANATPTSGYGPLTVNFSSAGSMDPDGSIVSYAWTFGDGGTSSAANPTYTYNTVGNYTARLTVTDNNGGTSSSTVAIVVSQDPNRVIYVQSITMSLVSSSRGTSARAVVTVYDRSGVKRPGVTVSAAFSGLVRGSVSGTTDANGQVVFTSAATKKRGTFTLTVNNLMASGYVYGPSFNVATAASITY